MIKKKSPSVLMQEVRKDLSFGFGDLRDASFIKAKNDSDFFIDFIFHMRQFCKMNWNDVRTTQRHGYGTETIDVKCLNDGIMSQVPTGLTKLLVLRATGNNHAFLGYRDGNVFQVLFIEYRFGDIYKHSK